VDLATGKPIPDFNVNGVLDVLHELGSGGSGTTYLCRDLKTAKVCVHGGRATLGALGKRGGGACLAVLTMSGGMMRTFALGTVGRGARALGGGGKEILQAADNVGWGGGGKGKNVDGCAGAWRASVCHGVLVACVGLTASPGSCLHSRASPGVHHADRTASAQLLHISRHLPTPTRELHLYLVALDVLMLCS
jgi:hypothetical protein